MSHISMLRERGFEADALLITTEINLRWLTGFDYSDGCVVVTRDGAFLLTDFRYLEAAKKECSAELQVQTPEQGHLACIRGILEEEKLTRVAVEEGSLSLGDYRRFCEKLPNCKLEGGATAVLEELRRFKDDAELDAMARAQAVTDAAFAHIVKFIQPNMTEIEVALELEFFMRRNGAEGLAFNTIAVSGSASALPHGVPRRTRLEKGFLTMDFGARVDGYCSDMTRTVVLGQADAEMKKLYSTVLTAQRAALEAACEGAFCRGLDKIARDIIDGNGFAGTFGHSLGHGVGLFIHESPRLSQRAGEDERLARGNVVTFEPGIYLEGKYGCRIEDMGAIRPDGSFINFTKSPKELIELF